MQMWFDRNFSRWLRIDLDGFKILVLGDIIISYLSCKERLPNFL